MQANGGTDGEADGISAQGLRELIQRADPAALLVEVDRLCATRDWDGLVTLRDRCLDAVEFGKQLWPVAQFAEYRLALEAPGPYAGSVCRTGAAKFALGPLTEVAASAHPWDELADHIDEPWIAATVAHERVVRGEDLRGDSRAAGEHLDDPLVLLEFEPAYPVPQYRAYELLEGGPDPIETGFATVDAAPGQPASLPRVERAMHEVAATWTERSNGDCVVAAVEGSAGAAAAALHPVPVRLAEVTAADALARLAWTAASGGALGRRRGMAAGRSSALWVLRAAADLALDAPPDELEAVVGRLRWFVLEAQADERPPGHERADAGSGGDPTAAPRGGWRLHLAVENEQAGWSAAVEAWDTPLEDQRDPRRFEL